MLTCCMPYLLLGQQPDQKAALNNLVLQLPLLWLPQEEGGERLLRCWIVPWWEGGRGRGTQQGVQDCCCGNAVVGGERRDT